ncbi:MAG: flagellar motor switch protein FliN [Acidimicrobiia bacterium]
MSTLETFLSDDVAPAERVAAAIESGTNGDLVLTVGEPITGASDTASLLPNAEARILGTPIGGDGGGFLAVALTTDLAESLRLAANQTVPVAVRPLIAAAVDALEQTHGPLGASDDMQEISGDELAGGGAALVAIPLLNGADRVATVILRDGGADIAGAPAGGSGIGGAAPHEFPPIGDGSVSGAVDRALELLNDVEMEVTAELGRRRLSVRDLLALTPGSVVELDRAAGSPVDVLVNGRVIARGEVVVIDEEFGIRISEVIGRDEESA